MGRGAAGNHVLRRLTGREKTANGGKRFLAGKKTGLEFQTRLGGINIVVSVRGREQRVWLLFVDSHASFHF